MMNGLRNAAQLTRALLIGGAIATLASVEAIATRPTLHPEAQRDLVESTESLMALQGREVTGSLNTESEQFEDGSYVERHEFDGEAGAWIVIDVQSNAFEPYVILRNADGQKLAQGRDRLVLRLPRTQTYAVEVNTWTVGETGAYRLEWLTVDLDSPTITDFGTPAENRAIARQLVQSTENERIPDLMAIELLNHALERYKALGDEAAIASVYSMLGTQYSWRPLQSFEVLQRIVPGQTSSHEIWLDRARLVRLTAEPIDADVSLTVYDPAGQLLTTQNEQGVDIPEQYGFTTWDAGRYRVEVEAISAAAPVGYQLSVEVRATATAIAYYQKAADQWQALERFDRQADVLREVGYEYGVLNRTGAAIAAYQDALGLYDGLEDAEGRADTLLELAEIYKFQDPQRAISTYRRALREYERLDQPADLLHTFTVLGDLYADQGEYEQAIAVYKRQLDLETEIDGEPGALTLKSLALLYRQMAHHQAALTTLELARDAFAREDDGEQQAVILNSMASLYNELGERDRALALLHEAEALLTAQETQSGYFLANLYNSLGVLTTDEEQAQRYFQQALDSSRSLPEWIRPFDLEGFILSNLGTQARDQGKLEQALGYYDEAIQLASLPGINRNPANRGRDIAEVMTLKGDLYTRQQQPEAARETLQTALAGHQRWGNRDWEAATRLALATHYEAQGALLSSRDQLRQAIAILEDLRTNIVSAELRSSFFATTQQYYDFYIRILMELHQQAPDQGYDAEAFAVSERARARSLLDLLTEARIDFRQGVDPELLNQEERLGYRFEALEGKRIQALGAGADETVQRIQRERDQVLADRQRLQNQIRDRSFHYAALRYPEPLTLESVQQQILDADTVLLQYNLGEEQSQLWVVSANQLQSYTLPPAAAIQTEVRRTLRVLKNPGRRIGSVLETSQALSDVVLAPVIEHLRGKRLLIVTDSTLQYIPFAALPDPAVRDRYQPLLQNHEIIHLPSASTLGILRQTQRERPTPPKTLAIFADPVFTPDDPRLEQPGIAQAPQALAAQQLNRAASDVGIAWRRLPGTRQEAEAILDFVPAAEQHDTFLDFQANRDQVERHDQLRDYRLLHFATHGFANPRQPELSGLVLSLFDPAGQSQNGFLRLANIFNLELNAELVVLSACQTGDGELVAGEGLVGLTRGFMYAGSQRVIATLWTIDDQSSAVLMAHFYQELLQSQQSPGAALRDAQLTIFKQERWQHPYYWAAFTLQGEW